jgi:hypothetical protein
MNTFFVLVLLIIPPHGRLVVAFEKEQFATVEECQKRSEERLEQAAKQVLWMSTSCAAVPINPTAKEG